MLSLKFDNIYINDYKTITSSNEKNGNLKKIDGVIDNYYYGEKTFEQAQIKMQREVINKILSNNNLIDQDIDAVVGGDLSSQLTSSTYAMSNFDISFLGIYSACSSYVEGLIISCLLLNNKHVKNVLNITSSHNLAQEREFRYPVEYGVIRSVNSTYTLTTSIASLLSHKKSNIKINNATIGSVINMNISDPNLIGAIMAPSAAELIVNHLNNFNLDINYYDLILTGDLGNVGLLILKDYLKEEFNIECNNIVDAGSNIYKDIGEINDGASGPTCLPLYLFYNVLKKKKFKKILLIGTGSLHSKVMVNQKLSIPSISHAVSLEVTN